MNDNTCNSRELVQGSGFRVMDYLGYTVPFPDPDEIERRGLSPNGWVGCGNSGCRERFPMVAEVETEIASLKRIKSSSSKRDKMVSDLEKGIKKVLKIIDNR